MRRSHRDIALRVHVDVPQDLITHVAAGLVDIAIMYAPPHRPGLEIDLLLEEELVLVTTDLKAYRADDLDTFMSSGAPIFPYITAQVFPTLYPA